MKTIKEEENGRQRAMNKMTKGKRENVPCREGNTSDPFSSGLRSFSLHRRKERETGRKEGQGVKER